MVIRSESLLQSTDGHPSENRTEDPREAWFAYKTNALNSWLGQEHDQMTHAVLGLELGGAPDLYYYPHPSRGTAIATKQLSPLPDQGLSNDVYSCFELAMFTRHYFDLSTISDQTSPFGRAHYRIHQTLTCLAHYGAQSKLNPGDTVAIPAQAAKQFGVQLTTDKYVVMTAAIAPLAGMARAFGLMFAIEIFPSEMEFASISGSRELLGRLNEAGHYPTSDMERLPVA